MSPGTGTGPALAAADGGSFKPLRVVVPVLAALLAISVAVRFYAHEVSMPRYCADPTGAVDHLERIVTEARPAGEDARRPYVVAAKLLFLVPREADEPLGAYLSRVRMHIEARCRGVVG